MYYFARLACLLLVGVACGSPKPPERGAAEAPALSEPEPAASPEPAPPGPDAAPVSTPGTAPAPEPASAASAATEAGGEGPASAPSDAPLIQTLFVRETLADCQAEGARQCLQVRSSDQEDWRNFFATIEGFQYEPSHAYELRVAVSPVPNAPADAPSLRYRLLEVISKRPVGKAGGK